MPKKTLPNNIPSIKPAEQVIFKLHHKSLSAGLFYLVGTDEARWVNNGTAVKVGKRLGHFYNEEEDKIEPGHTPIFMSSIATDAIVTCL